jgi:tetratricopeptide (TPR) repeat protein
MTPLPPSARSRRLRGAAFLAALLAAGLVRAAAAETAATEEHGATPAPAAKPADLRTPSPAAKPAAPTPAEHPAEAAASATAPGRAEEARSLMKLGTSLSDRGDYAAAELAFRRILNSAEATDADQADALLGLARMFRRSGAFVKAAAIYEKFLKQFPEGEQVPDAMLDLGRTLRAMGAYRMALSRFYSVINSTLKIPSGGFEHYQLLAKTAQFEIAETHFESGDYAEAGKFYGRVRLLDLAPADRARAHFKSAASLDLAGDHEEALTTLRAYLQQWPNDEDVPEARYLLATTLRKLDRPAEALNATLDLLRTEHDRSDQRRWTYWQRRTGNQLANEFFQQGDIRTALAIYQGLAALSNEDVWRLPNTYQTALCYERLGQTDRAHAAFQSILDALAAEKNNDNEELADLGRMTSWRLAHMNWSEDTISRLNVFFTTSRAASPAATPAATPAAAAPTPTSHGSPAPTP